MVHVGEPLAGDVSGTQPPHRAASSIWVVPAVIAPVLGAAAGLAWGLTAPGVVNGDQLGNVFTAMLAFVGISAVCGLLTGSLVFRGARRTPAGVAVALVVAVVGVVIATVLGQLVADARFADQGVPGLHFTGAPSIRLRGANFYAPADHSGGFLGDLSSWVLVLIWPGFAALWCTIAALFGRLPGESRAGTGIPLDDEPIPSA